MERCIELGIEILAITDHDSLEGYRRAKKIIGDKKLPIVLVPACEISSKDGHILAYGILREIPAKLSAKETIELIHQQGGLAIAAHPFNKFGSSLNSKIKKLDLDAMESYCVAQTKLATRKAVRLAKKLNMISITGSDAHALMYLGKGKMVFGEGIKSWQEIIEKIRVGDFEMSIDRKKSLVSFTREYVKKNMLIRKLERSWR